MVSVAALVLFEVVVDLVGGAVTEIKGPRFWFVPACRAFLVGWQLLLVFSFFWKRKSKGKKEGKEGRERERERERGRGKGGRKRQNKGNTHLAGKRTSFPFPVVLRSLCVDRHVSENASRAHRPSSSSSCGCS